MHREIFLSLPHFQLEIQWNSWVFFLQSFSQPFLEKPSCRWCSYSCRMPISKRVFKNGREWLVCCYGGGIELVAAAGMMIKWKQWCDGISKMSSIGYLWRLPLMEGEMAKCMLVPCRPLVPTALLLWTVCSLPVNHLTSIVLELKTCITTCFLNFPWVDYTHVLHDFRLSTVELDKALSKLDEGGQLASHQSCLITTISLSMQFLNYIHATEELV